MSFPIFKISAIRKKMKSKVPSTQIYSFFDGANNLTAAQISQLQKIVEGEVDKMNKFLATQKEKASQSK